MFALPMTESARLRMISARVTALQIGFKTAAQRSACASELQTLRSYTARYATQADAIDALSARVAELSAVHDALTDDSVRDTITDMLQTAMGQLKLARSEG